MSISAVGLATAFAQSSVNAGIRGNVRKNFMDRMLHEGTPTLGAYDLSHSPRRPQPPHFNERRSASGSCFASHSWKTAQNAHKVTTARSGRM
jgi:hypothetical protein